MSKTRAITPNPPADFTPSLGDYKTLQPFRYWCQKVLPLVYDDSLSYYELLCKVVDYLNKTMEDVEVLHSDVTNLHEAYEELQEYVNNYFSSLDVQAEIDNKLDVMAKDGTLSSIMVKFAKPYPIFVDSIGEMTNHELNYVLTTDGYIYYYNGSSFVSSGIHYGTNALYIKSYGSNFNDKPPVTDLNSAPLNTVLVFTRNSLLDGNVANVPTLLDFSRGFNLFTYGADTDNIAGSAQVAVSLIKGNVAYRANAGTWTEWVYMADFKIAMKGYGTNFNDSNPPVTDLNSAPLNTVIVFTRNSLRDGGVANTPTSDDFSRGFNLFTYGADTDNIAGSVQVAVSITSGDVAYRANAQTWTEWIYLTDNKTIMHAAPNDDFNSKVIQAYNTGATLILEAGDYNIDYSNPYGTGRYRGLPIGNDCKIIGNGTVNINLNYTGGDAEFSQNLSAFNVYGKCKLKNLNINVNNILYCVHDDASAVNKYGFTVEYENVNMSCNGVLGGGENISTCIGGGVITNDLRIINGGTFKTNAYTAPITYHNGSNGKDSTILIKGAYVDGNIRLYDFAPTADVLNAYISNSKFNAIQYSGEKNRFNTILFNNETN